MNEAASPSPDTIATLLLCGRFGPAREGVKLLSPSEYHDLEQWLNAHRLTFGDLIKPDAKSIVRSYASRGLEVDRFLALLKRTDELSRAFERWSKMGIWVVGQTDPHYPRRLRQRLKLVALPLLFGAGPRTLLDGGGVCIVGSRDSPKAALDFARTIGARCAREGMTVVSSDMRGVDREAVTATLDEGGKVICVLSDCLEKALTAKRHRHALAANALVMVTPFSPDTRFKVANAIRANKYQYTLSDVAVIVETREKGGVWLGAEENRHEGWVPAFVRTGENMSQSNLALLHLGLIPITCQDVVGCESLREFFVTHALSVRSATTDAKATGAQTSRPAAPVDLYSIFIAELRTIAAAAPRSETEIVNHFGIERSQARKWLARALAEGVVKKAGEAERYTTR
jgi:predicted Rossmann fold nucleotide-binding protein DprA/Smf involved in DNA uptake